MQSSPTPQTPTGPRRLLSGTPATVSYASETAAAEPPAGQLRGSLAWLATADAQGRGRYRLEFAVPVGGRMDSRALSAGRPAGL